MEFYQRNGLVHPMDELDLHEAALAGKIGAEEAPYHPPARDFYFSNYLLDGSISADLRTAYGYYAKAEKQLLSFRTAQRPDGMVPGVIHPPTRFSVNPERWLSLHPFEGNDYTQTPKWAHSVLLLHSAAGSRPAASAAENISPDGFLKNIYPYLDRYYRYFINHRQVASYDPRPFMLHPHEGNRDSGPEYEDWKDREKQAMLGPLARFFEYQPRTGAHMPREFNRKNRRNDYIGALAINAAGRKAGWQPERIRQRGEFVDLWFSCHLYEGYLSMSELAARLGKHEDSIAYADLAIRLSTSIQAKNYFRAARGGRGGFYSTYKGAPMLKETNGNLAVLLLRDLPFDKLSACLDLMDQGFSPPFPLPSVATFETAYYDPFYEEEDRHWQGPKWIVADDTVKRALLFHIKRPEMPPELFSRVDEWILKIEKSNYEAVKTTGGFAEHYNPITGQGQRLHKTLGHVFGIPMPSLYEDSILGVTA